MMKKNGVIVVRRVGGLEVTPREAERLLEVVRRVGGLEELFVKILVGLAVVRRVGGLEGCLPC